MVTFHWEHLTEFQRLILIKVLKPMSLTASVRVFVEEQMGPKFVNFGAADLNEIFEKSDAKTPLIFILSPGMWNYLIVWCWLDLVSYSQLIRLSVVE